MRVSESHKGLPNPNKGKKMPQWARYGPDSPNWKGGRPVCSVCGKVIKYGAKNCLKHAANRPYKKGKAPNPLSPFVKGHTLTKGDKNPRWGKGYLQTGDKNPCWKGGKPKCVDCGKSLRHYGDTRCLICYRKFARGENSPAWKGGISKEPYPFKFTKALKETIRRRDSYRCQLCGVPERELIHPPLSIHHIDYDKNNLAFRNLISLCKSCNSKVNNNRPYWKEYFNETRTIA